MKKLTSLLLIILLMVTQSCVVYQKTSVTLKEAEQAVPGHRAIQLINKSTNEFYFKRIITIDNSYYGVMGRDTVKIDQTQIDRIYLKDIYKTRQRSAKIGTIIFSPFLLWILIAASN